MGIAIFLNATGKQTSKQTNIDTNAMSKNSEKKKLAKTNAKLLMEPAHSKACQKKKCDYLLHF